MIIERTSAMSRRGWYAMSAVFLCLAVFSVVLELLASHDSWWLHGVWCVLGVFAASPVLYRTFRNGVGSVVYDHRIMLILAFVLYFLIGASMLTFGSEADIQKSQRYYPITANDALHVDALNALGFAIAIFAATWFSGGTLIGGARRAAALFSRIPSHLVILFFFIIGGLGFMVIVFRDLGLVELVVPGIITQLSMLLIFCVFIGSAFSGRISRFINALALVCALVMMAMGFLLFNKTMLYLPVLAYFAGLNVRTKSSKYLIYGVMVVGLTLGSLGDLVSYGRTKVANSNSPGMTLGERIGVVKSYIGGDRIFGMEDYSAWSRLSYTVPQTAAIDFYDQGNGGDGVSLIPWLFVPRFIAPDKPVITRSGSEFNYKVVGSDKSSTGMGVFVSGYYNLGWFGFIFASVFCGWYLAQSSALCELFISRNALIILPFGLIGLYAAFRIDGEIIADYIGSYVFVLYALIAFYMIPISRRSQ